MPGPNVWRFAALKVPYISGDNTDYPNRPIDPLTDPNALYAAKARWPALPEPVDDKPTANRHAHHRAMPFTKGNAGRRLANNMLAT